jgi:hypothetical protein
MAIRPSDELECEQGAAGSGIDQEKEVFIGRLSLASRLRIREGFLGWPQDDPTSSAA